MDKEFNEMFEVILLHETGAKDGSRTGLVNDPDDPGGLTKYGISQRAFPHLNIKDLKLEDAKRIYYDKYYMRPINLKQFPYRTRLALFDANVNHGPNASFKLLQEAINSISKAELKVDGIFGPKTKTAIENLDDMLLFNSIIMHRERLFRKIASSPRMLKFLKGWINRLKSLQREVDKYNKKEKSITELAKGY